ncbi:MAG TPA: amino-acid N-acetyltransferase [Candidatus Didemnitutus sp.]|nr:amino-acid N-acetyltransferase [Candidatus Didemnitutus sp.]
MADNVTIKPTDLRGILKYVPRFQGQIFIIAVDGSIVADDNFPNLMTDVSVLRSLGIKIVIVHGIGQQLEELAKLRNVAISDSIGTGVTDAATLDLAIRASARVTHVVLEGLTANGLKAALTNSVRAAPLGILRGVDHQSTGKVDRVDKEFIQHLIDAGIVPIVSPIGFDRDGRPLRVNSDHLAAELAEVLRATKIIYLTPMLGLEIGGKLQHDISVDTLRKVIDTKVESINEPMRSKAAHAVKAIDAGTPRIHLLDGRELDGLLAEIFSNEGVGTLIYGNEYQQIRKATRRDVRAIYNLTRSGMKREELRNRSQQAIEKTVDQFYVFEIDENLIACVSLYIFPEKPTMAEVGTLYVMPFYHDRGIGQKMVEFACLQAKERGANTVLALSTQAYTFFTSVCHFEEAEKDVLPESRLKSYEDSGRNSKILIKKL